MASYDLCIIGSGSGNTIIDERFDDWRVALVDDGPTFGGTCLNRGCIPTKMFVYPADLVRLRDSAPKVNTTLDAAADFAAIRDRVFGRIDPIAGGGEAWRRRASNVDLFRETARFVGPKTLAVGEQTITAERFVLAAGARPVWPDVPGLDALKDRAHTSDTIMRLQALPKRLLIWGGGFIAAEFAHVFSALGSQVTIVNRSSRLLRREDALIGTRYTQAARAYAEVLLDTTITGFENTPSAALAHVDTPDGPRTLEADVVLVALGRRPNGDRLGVEATGVKLDDDGYVVVDEHQATGIDGIWALGDICSRFELKHVANAEARTVQHNLLHPDEPRATDHRFVPHAVFGSPQVASVGQTEDAAREAGLDIVTAVQEYASVAYGWAMETTEGSAAVKLVADRATKQLVGAHIVGPQASLLIQPLIQAMSLGTDVPTMARGQYWIHPALTEVVENALLGLNLEP